MGRGGPGRRVSRHGGRSARRLYSFLGRRADRRKRAPAPRRTEATASGGGRIGKARRPAQMGTVARRRAVPASLRCARSGRGGERRAVAARPRRRAHIPAFALTGTDLLPNRARPGAMRRGKGMSRRRQIAKGALVALAALLLLAGLAYGGVCVWFTMHARSFVFAAVPRISASPLDSGLNDVEEVTIRTEDGERLYGW